MEEVGATEAGRERAAPRRTHDRECRICGRRFATSGRGAYCGHACKKRAYRARKREAELRGTDEDPLIKALDAFREKYYLGNVSGVTGADLIRESHEERDDDIWRAVTS